MDIFGVLFYDTAKIHFLSQIMTIITNSEGVKVIWYLLIQFTNEYILYTYLSLVHSKKFTYSKCRLQSNICACVRKWFNIRNGEKLVDERNFRSFEAVSTFDNKLAHSNAYMYVHCRNICREADNRKPSASRRRKRAKSTLIMDQMLRIELMSRFRNRHRKCQVQALEKAY